MSASAVFLDERPAHACGGCFAPPTEKTGQIIENNVHSASVYADTAVTTTSVPRGNGCSSVPSKDSAGAASLFVLTGLFVRRMVRRRRGR
ncbi:MAG TPA: hypothetical protein VF316_05665 [Polyangiaceae bacterium]